MNRLFYGDNLDVLHRYIADASVDFIYLDPCSRAIKTVALDGIGNPGDGCAYA
jgi:hypothetical protein